MAKVRIAHITTVHPRADTRIRVREVGSLADAYDEPVALFVQDGKGNATEADGKVQIIDTGHPPVSRLARMTLGVWRMWRALQSVRPQLVHFHDPELIPLGMVLKCLGYRVVYDVHEDLPRQVLTKYWLPAVIRRPVSWTMSACEWLAARVLNAIVPATPEIAGHFPPHKTTLVQNFPILDELVTVESRLYTTRPPHFAYIGGISVLRGIHQMIQATAGAHTQAGPTPRLCLAGTFQPAELLEEVQGSTAWSQVDFHGWADRKQVAQLLSRARAGLVVFHPAPNHLDAYPTKMFEYMSVGLPVLVSDFPLWRTIVEDAGCGLTVDPLDPQAIAGAMRWILDHPAEAEVMGQRGREAVEKYYNWETEADKLVNLYKNLLLT